MPLFQIYFIMKMKFFLPIILVLILTAFFSCKTDVDIFTEGKETTIVYGYLDVDADTNFLKITKSFVGNAIETAPDYSASNYDYKLDVKLKGKFADMPNVVTTTILDTTSVYKPYDPTGIFYSGRDQVLYYTTRKLKEHEDYELVIERKDGVILTSKVRTIGGGRITKPWSFGSVSFESNKGSIEWQPNNSQELAAYYEVVGYFNYKQLNPGETDTVSYQMKWVLGTGTAEQLWNSADRRLIVNYTPKNFYSYLESDDNIANNSPEYVQRFVENFEIVITSTGEELYDYILIQNSTGAIQDTPEFTNIENGMGIFSSRAVVSGKYEVGEHSINTLIRDYPQWGFVKIYQ